MVSRDLAALVGFLLQGVDGGPDRRAGGGAVAPEREDVATMRTDRGMA